MPGGARVFHLAETESNFEMQNIMCRAHESDKASQGLEAALGGALGVAAHRHGLVVLAGVLDIDVDELDAAARLRVRAEQADGLGRGRGAGDVAERNVLD